MFSPWFISAKSALLSCPAFIVGAPSPRRSSIGGGSGTLPPGGGGGALPLTFGGFVPPQTKPVVWYCLTNACNSESVWTHAFVQSTWILSLKQKFIKTILSSWLNRSITRSTYFSFHSLRTRLVKNCPASFISLTKGPGAGLCNKRSHFSYRKGS